MKIESLAVRAPTTTMNSKASVGEVQEVTVFFEMHFADRAGEKDPLCSWQTIDFCLNPVQLIHT